MESSSQSGPASAQAAAALADAEAARERLAGAVVVPPRFFVALGAVVAVQIALTAAALGAEEPLLLVGGLAIFASSSALLLWHFRRQNGVSLGGFASRVVFGTSTTAMVSEAVALAAATWAAFASLWWLVALCSIAGGAAYAVSGIRWLRAYHATPASHARGESAVFLALVGLAMFGGLVLLLVFG
jgi:hypothetical protein